MTCWQRAAIRAMVKHDSSLAGCAALVDAFDFGPQRFQILLRVGGGPQPATHLADMSQVLDKERATA